MGRYTGPKVRLSKRVRAPIAETPKHMKADTERGPGQHGFRRRRKTTLYGERLTEKQGSQNPPEEPPVENVRIVNCRIHADAESAGSRETIYRNAIWSFHIRHFTLSNCEIWKDQMALR